MGVPIIYKTANNLSILPKREDAKAAALTIMKDILEVFIFVVIGIFLLWFGYTLFFAMGPGGGKRLRRRNIKPRGEGVPGDPQTCPVCSGKLQGGELVSSLAFPSLNGGKDRFMHIRGCIFCLRGDRERLCPVCGAILEGDEILICRLFDRGLRRSHVHVLGCSQCKSLKSGRR